MSVRRGGSQIEITRHTTYVSAMQVRRALMTPLKLYGQGARSQKARLVALFAGVELEIPPFTAGTTNKTPWYLKMNPNGTWPVLQTPNGALFESNVICKYLATIGSNPSLYPASTSPQVASLSRAGAEFLPLMSRHA